MTTLLQRLPSPMRVLRASPLRVLTGIAIAMAAVAVYATSLKLERLLFGLGIDAKQVDAGVILPAMAFDGHSTGTIAFSSFDELGTHVVGAAALTHTESIRAIVLPYYWSEFINALLVLALCAVVLLLCIRMLRGGPFVAPTTASLAVFAVLLGVGSIASQLARRSPFGTESPSVRVLRDRATEAIASTGDLAPADFYLMGSPYVPGGEPGLDLFPLGIAILVGVIAAAFWLGHRMQRDTEGLV